MNVSTNAIPQMVIFKGQKSAQFRIISIVEWNAHVVEPAIYTALFHDPDECKDGSTYFRDNMPKDREKLIEAYPGRTLHGLYFEHIALGGRIIAAVLIIISFVFANIWSTKRSDIGGGFSVGQYIVTLISISLLFVFNRKDKS